MKKWLFFILVFLVLIIVGCKSQESSPITGATTILREVVKCGDNICDETEGCDCLDCENDARCFAPAEKPLETKEAIEEACDKTKENCCGNGKCESGERCNFETYQTLCPEDCTLECPAKLVVGDPKEEEIFFCVGNCDFYNNRFTIRGNSKIMTAIKNIGERASNTVTSDFNCYTEDEVLSKTDNDGNYGIIVRDYFEDGKQRLDSINSRVSGDNIVNYIFEVDVDNLKETRDVTCSITLVSVPDLQRTYQISMSILKGYDYGGY